MFGTIFFMVITNGTKRFFTLVANYKDLILIDENGNREDICEFLFCDFLKNPIGSIREIQGQQEADMIKIIARTTADGVDTKPVKLAGFMFEYKQESGEIGTGWIDFFDNATCDVQTQEFCASTEYQYDPDNSGLDDILDRYNVDMVPYSESTYIEV